MKRLTAVDGGGDDDPVAHVRFVENFEPEHDELIKPRSRKDWPSNPRTQRSGLRTAPRLSWPRRHRPVGRRG